MPETLVPSALVDAYRATHFHVQDGQLHYVLHVDLPSPELAAACARSGQTSAIFITADNPFSETVGAEANAANHEALGRSLRALTADVFEGFGQDPAGSWPAEQSYLALGVDRTQACALGIQFRQNAIVWAGADATPELILLR